MGKDPAFLFYPGDWLGGTITFTRAQKGAYMDLLMAQFNQGGLSLDDIKLVLGTDFWMWDAKLVSKFDLENGLYSNPRLQKEVVRRQLYTNSRKNNQLGIKKGHMTSHMTGHMENENINEIKDKKVKHLDTVLLTPDEYLKLIERFGSTGTKDRIEELNTGIMSKGYKYKSHYHTILSWDKRRSKDEPSKPKVIDHNKRYEETQRYLKSLEEGLAK